jgi:hypothetical protein
MGLGELVRRSCRRVVETSTLVVIDDERLQAYAAGITDELVLAPAVDGAAPELAADAPLPDRERVAAHVLTLDAVNFGSGYHDVVDKEPGLSGSRTMALRWKRYLASGVPSPVDLQGLGADGCARIFGQSLDHPDQGELMGLFADALADLGSLVAGRYGGSYLALVEAAGGSAEALATSLLAMPLYLDRYEGGRPVHFYKRAQISAADLARAFGHQPPARFADLDRLTAFADNLVPHVLRVDGILRYQPELADRIDDRLLLPPGSPAEIEIRAAGVDAVERLVAVLADAGHRTRAMDLDLALWARGQGARYKAVPRHRTRCTFY